MDISYCNNCGDTVRFHTSYESIEEIFHDKPIRYEFLLGRCNNCNCEVATDIDYNSRKSIAKIMAYNAKYFPPLIMAN